LRSRRPSARAEEELVEIAGRQSGEYVAELNRRQIGSSPRRRASSRACFTIASPIGAAVR
jgi:hypothetical protein